MSDDDKVLKDRVMRRGLLGMSAVGAAAAAGAGLFTASEAQAQEAQVSKLRTVLDRGHLIVGTGSTNPPWHFEDETGKLVGMDIDLAHLLAKSLFDDPEKVEFVIQGSDARIPSLVTDIVDIVCQFMTVTAGRAQQVEFTIPYYREGVTVLMLADSKHKTIDDLRAAGSGLTISALQNVFIEDWAHMAMPEARVDQFESEDAALQALNSGRSDGYLADQSAARWLIAKNPGRYIDCGYGWMPNSYASAVKPGDTIWLNWVNTVYKEAMMGVDFQTFAASYKKWFGIELKTPNVGFPSEFAPS